MLSSGTDNLKLSKKPGQAKQHQRKKSNMARLPLPGKQRQLPNSDSGKYLGW